MIEVEVPNNNIWTHWLRVHSQGYWKVRFGTDVDWYYFENSSDADKLKSHILQHEYRMKRILEQSTKDDLSQ